MKYTIDYVSTFLVAGWYYRVTLIIGRTRYVGTTLYKTHAQAARAAKRTGAKEAGK